MSSRAAPVPSRSSASARRSSSRWTPSPAMWRRNARLLQRLREQEALPGGLGLLDGRLRVARAPPRMPPPIIGNSRRPRVDVGAQRVVVAGLVERGSTSARRAVVRDEVGELVQRVGAQRAGAVRRRAPPRAALRARLAVARVDRGASAAASRRSTRRAASASGVSAAACSASSAAAIGRPAGAASRGRGLQRRGDLPRRARRPRRRDGARAAPGCAPARRAGRGSPATRRAACVPPPPRRSADARSAAARRRGRARRRRAPPRARARPPASTVGSARARRRTRSSARVARPAARRAGGASSRRTSVAGPSPAPGRARARAAGCRRTRRAGVQARAAASHSPVLAWTSSASAAASSGASRELERVPVRGGRGPARRAVVRLAAADGGDHLRAAAARGAAATNERTARLAASSHCQSSTASRTRRAARASSDRQASATSRGSTGSAASSSSNAAASARRCGTGSRASPSDHRLEQVVQRRVGARRLGRGGPRPQHRRLRRPTTASSSAVLPTPASPSMNTANGAPAATKTLAGARELRVPADDRVRERHRATLARMPPQVKPG